MIFRFWFAKIVMKKKNKKDEDLRMNNEKEWHELRRKVMHSSDIDEEAKHWKEIDRRLKSYDKMSKEIFQVEMKLETLADTLQAIREG